MLCYSSLFYCLLLLFSSLSAVSPENGEQQQYEVHFCKEGIKLSEKYTVLEEDRLLRTYWIHRLYNPEGQLLELSEEGEGMTKTTRYSYNAQNQLESVIKPDGRHLYYSYNEEGNIARFEDGDGSFCYYYHYDSLKRLVTVEDLCHQLTQTIFWFNANEWMEEQGPAMRLIYQQDESGRRTGLTLPDGSRILYHYEGERITGMERLDKNQQSCYFHSFSYIESPWRRESVPEGGRDSAGRLLKLIKKEEEGQEEQEFNYTKEGFLANEKNHVYTYDSLFNRLSHQGQEWKINGLNQLVETPHASYRYDANGNLIEKQTSDGSIFYDYDGLDRLIRVEYPGQKAWSYLYDPFHRRIAQSLWKWNQEERTWILESKEWFLYDGFHEIGKFNEKGECLELRLLAPPMAGEKEQAIAVELAGKRLIPLHDFWGSICSLVDPERGRVVEKYTYSAYGEEEIFNAEGEKLAVSSLENPWRFCGCRKDETGLIFFGKRYYDPEMGRWTTPDPLFFCDLPNLYVFSRNDPVNYYDLHGLFSIAHLWANLKQSATAYLHCLFQPFTWKGLRLPQSVNQGIEKLVKNFFGESSYALMGYNGEATEHAFYGDIELGDKVRLSFINGILITKSDMLANLEFISQTHGDIKVHYVFRPTEGFTSDILRAIMIKLGFGAFGFRSQHAHLLAKKWRELIAEMGGVGGGGTVLHYAHSLGGSETDRARELLTPEEQKMIRVITFGSATMIRNEGFEQVINIVSVNDGICVLDPLGRMRNYFGPETNIWFHGSLTEAPYWPTDHLLQGRSYEPVVHQLGEQFLKEFKREDNQQLAMQQGLVHF